MRICSNGCRAPASDTFSAPSGPGSAVPGGNPRAVTSSVRARIHRLARDVRGPGSRRGPVRPGHRAGRPVRGSDRVVRPPRDGVPAAGGVEHGAVAPAADARDHARRVRRPQDGLRRPVQGGRPARGRRDPDRTISLSSGDGIRVTGRLTGSFTFTYDATAGQASLTKPSMTIATTADLPSGTTMKAGLGILGVAVTGDAGDSEADYHLESTVTTSWANPDNDAAGT